ARRARLVAGLHAAAIQPPRGWLVHRAAEWRATGADQRLYRHAAGAAESAAFWAAIPGAALSAPERRCAVRWRALVLKEWRILLRDRHALAVLFLMPTLFLLLMAMAMSNINLDRPPQVDLQLHIGADSDATAFFQQAISRQLPLRSLSIQHPAGSTSLGLSDHN